MTMNQPDFEQAKHYALERLERELPTHLLYHSVAHTRDDVVPAAERLAALMGVNGETLLLLRTAAYFHDIGFVVQPASHEDISARIATEVLPGFDYSPAQIQMIAGMIMATRLPQSPHNLLEEIMADADLDVLGRDDFFPRHDALRAELAVSGRPMTDEQWYSVQLKFIQAHRYWTAAARTLRDAHKQEIIAAIARLLAQSQAQSRAEREEAR
jgi:uncharacterized protein